MLPRTLRPSVNSGESLSAGPWRPSDKRQAKRPRIPARGLRGV